MITSGIQSGLWTKSNSPYLVTDDIIIPKGLTLKIEPGVEIQFNGPFRFIVAGALVANGSADNPITFTSLNIHSNFNQYNKFIRWYGIDFTDSSDDYICVLDYCNISHSQFGIRCRDAYPVLTQIKIVDISENSLVINDQKILIKANTFTDYLTQNQRPKIIPVPEPLEEVKINSVEKKNEIDRLAKSKKAYDDSIRIANKIKPTATLCSILTLEAKDFDALGFDQFTEILSFFPGFINMPSYFDNSILTCRGIFPGLFNNKLLVKVNNIPIYDGVTNSAFYEFIPFSSIDKIEIIRGPEGIYHGKNAFSGIINIITRKTDHPVEILTAAKIGSYYTKKIHTHIGFIKGDYDFCFGTTYKDDNGYSRVLDSEEFGKKFTLNFEEDCYNIFLSTRSNNLTLVASYFRQNESQSGIIPVQEFNGVLNKEGLMLLTNYKKKLKNNLSSELTTRYSSTLQQYKINPIASAELENAYNDITITRGFIFQSEIKLNYQSSKWPSTIGISAERNGAKCLFDQTSKYNNSIFESWDLFSKTNYPDINEFSFFAYSGYNISPFWGLKGGIRWSYLGPISVNMFSPGLTLIFNPFAPYHIQLSYKQGYRSPSLLEQEIQLKDVLYGNPMLNPEKNHQFEISANYTFSSSKKIDLALYQQNIYNIIYQRELEIPEQKLFKATSGYIFKNTETIYKLYGGEVNIQSDLLNKVTFFLNCAYQKFSDQGNILHWPDLAGNFCLNYQHDSKLSTSFNLQYIGKQSKSNSSLIINPKYLLNYRINFHILPKISLDFIVNNIFNVTCFYSEFNRRKLNQIPGGYPRSIYLLLKSTL